MTFLTSPLQRKLIATYLVLALAVIAAVGVFFALLPEPVLLDASRAGHRLRWALLIGGLVGLALAMLLGFRFARYVTQPIVETTAVARQMAEGDFSQRISTTSSDEIGRLGGVLNLLSMRLKGRFAELEEERAKGAAILDSMVEGVLAVDGMHRILFINASACRLFNISSVVAEGRPFLEVIRNKEMLDLLNQTLREGVFAPRELQIFTPVQRILQVHASPLKSSEGSTGALWVMHDVTELRRLETARTEFVANVSHELRTPLTSVRGYLETLLEGALEDREHARPFLEVIHKHTERLGRLLDDLLDLSNLELGKVTLHRQPTVLDEVVENVMAIYGPQAVKQETRLRTDLPHDLPCVLADRDRIAQVLINLVDNGLKFTPKGGTVRVSASLSHPTPDTLPPAVDFVEIAVADTGIGIPSQDLPRITERFYRVDRARSRELGGTGLGLAIVKHLVKAHGGEITIESQLNQGTTVRFTLPIAFPGNHSA